MGRKATGNIQQRGASFRISFHREGRRKFETCPTREEAERRLAYYLKSESELRTIVPDLDPRKTYPGFGISGIYFLRSSSNGLVKIGRSGNIGARLASLATISSIRLDVMAIIPIAKHSKAEAWLHRRFRSQRLHGEWFKIDGSDIESAVRDFLLSINEAVTERTA